MAPVDRVRQVAAGAVLLTATVGVPAALVTLLGSPLPPTLTAAADAVTRLPSVLVDPVSSGTVVEVLAVVAWVAWSYFTAGLLVELVNVTARRARPQLRLPVLGPGQDLARSLVVAALLLGVTAPFAPAPSPPIPAAPVGPASSSLRSDGAAASAAFAGGAAPSSERAAAQRDVPGQAGTDPEVTAAVPPPSGGDGLAALTRGAPAGRAAPGAGGWPTTPEQGVDSRTGQPPGYVVAVPAAGRYDCLWDIAERELGDGTRWTEIYDLNAGRPQSDGRTLDDPDLVRPGWRLELPPDARPATSRIPVASSGHHVVVPGDTLWQIAEVELGDGARYGELAAAAGTVTQSDGRTLQDSDLLRPGWVIPLPGSTPDTSSPPTSQPAPEVPAGAPATQTPGPETPQVPAVDDIPDLADPTPAGADQRPAPRPAAGGPGPTPRPAQERDPADAAGRGAAVDDTPAPRSGADIPEDVGEVPRDVPLEVDDQLERDEDANADGAGDVVEVGLVSPSWALAGLSGAGTTLAGSLLLLLRQRRAAQARERRPGRTLAVPGAEHTAAEMSVRVHAATATTLQWLDELLRRLAAARVATGDSLPAVAAVRLARAGATLHLSRPAELPGPWSGTADMLQWHWKRDLDLDQAGPHVPDQPAPYPLLVTVGADSGGATWLLDLEQRGAMTVTGDPGRAGDLLRYIAAELACNPWADVARVICVGIAGGLVPLNPDRLQVTHGADWNRSDDAAGKPLPDPDRVDGPGRPGGPEVAEVSEVADLVAGMVAGAVAAVDDCVELGLDVVDARVRQAGDHPWTARILLLDPEVAAAGPTGAVLDPSAGNVLDVLTDLVTAHPGRTGTAALVRRTGHARGGEETAPGIGEVHVSAAGYLSFTGTLHGMPADGLTATGLSPEEARGCAALFALGSDDRAMPVHPESPGSIDGTDGWRAFADQAGALRAEHGLPRPGGSDEPHSAVQYAGAGEAVVSTWPQEDDEADPTEVGPWVDPGGGAADLLRVDSAVADGTGNDGDGRPDGPAQVDVSGTAVSVLAARDEDYLAVAATTRADLGELAPVVPDHVTRRVLAADPDLDDDVAAWFSAACPLPRLTLLGPVGARTRGVPVTKRKPYYTELLAYLATRPHGATSEEVAAAFDITPTKARGYVGTVREWLGRNPRTGSPHVPDARRSTAAEDRGVGTYQVEDLLVDADLFRRLRLRGETRGPDGIADLRRALTLVTGALFSRLRAGGWAWLADGDRLDQHMLCAVVDVAHLVTTHLLQVGDVDSARTTAELAALAAPDEEIPRLDLAAVAAASGHHQAAADIARGDICNRTDEIGPPDELVPRTQEILDRHGWLVRSEQAS